MNSIRFIVVLASALVCAVPVSAQTPAQIRECSRIMSGDRVSEMANEVVGQMLSSNEFGRLAESERPRIRLSEQSGTNVMMIGEEDRNRWSELNALDAIAAAVRNAIVEDGRARFFVMGAPAADYDLVVTLSNRPAPTARPGPDCYQWHFVLTLRPAGSDANLGQWSVRQLAQLTSQ